MDRPKSQPRLVALGVGMLACIWSRCPHFHAPAIAPSSETRPITSCSFDRWCSIEIYISRTSTSASTTCRVVNPARSGCTGTSRKPGHVRNYMPVGPALLWAPLYLLAAGLHAMLAFAGLIPRPDGFEWTLQLMAGVTGIAASTAGAWISWRLARARRTRSTAAIATVAVWMGTHALYYSLVSPAYSHSASMLTSVVVLCRPGCGGDPIGHRARRRIWEHSPALRR